MPQFLLSHRGTIAGVDDEFVHTLVVNGSGTPQSVAQTVVPLWNNILTTLRGDFSPTITWTGISAAEILNLADGTLSAAFFQELPAPAPGAGSDVLPAQVAACVSVWAGTRPNGQPLKGRFYLPVPAAENIDSGGLFLNSFLNAVLTNVNAYFGDLIDAGLDPGIYSRTLAQFSTATLVRVGNKPDTIRTRRNSLPEVYVEAVPPTP